MIAVLHSIEIPARLLRASARNLRRQVEGPFRSWICQAPNDQEWRLYHVPPGIDSHYAAARLAARRGAELIIGIGAAHAAESFLSESGTEAHKFYFASRCHDFRALEPIQRLMPDNAAELPAPLPQELPGVAWMPEVQHGEAYPVGSVALPLTVPRLADELFRQYDTGLFDRSSAGVLGGAAQSGIPAGFAVWLRGPVLPCWESAAWKMPEQSRLEKALEELFLSGGLLDASNASPILSPDRG